MSSAPTEDELIREAREIACQSLIPGHDGVFLGTVRGTVIAKGDGFTGDELSYERARDALRAGIYDKGPSVRNALAGLRRGIELAGSGEQVSA